MSNKVIRGFVGADLLRKLKLYFYYSKSENLLCRSRNLNIPTALQNKTWELKSAVFAVDAIICRINIKLVPEK